MPTLEDGHNAINRGNMQQGRLIFEALLQENPRNEDAWLGLAEVLTETSDKRICYENVLKINKENRAAREGLRNLEPQADPLRESLIQQSSARAAEETEPPDEEGVPEPPVEMAPPPVEEETPTPVLVAVGVALSIVIFAVGGGLAFFVLSALAGG